MWSSDFYSASKFFLKSMEENKFIEELYLGENVFEIKLRKYLIRLVKNNRILKKLEIYNDNNLLEVLSENKSSEDLIIIQDNETIDNFDYLSQQKIINKLKKH